MKTQDIRIGNLVYDSLRNKEVQIQLKHFKELYISEKMFFERYKGIVITEERFLAFGFEDNNLKMSGLKWFEKSTKGIWKSGIRISKRQDDIEGKWSVTLECVSPPTLAITHIKYVHELQTLHFALKNEELPIA